MKICLTLKIIVCELFCVFTVDIKGQTCQCQWNGVKCTCHVGCYSTSGGRCNECQPNCVSCPTSFYCDVCKPGYYGHICDHDCNTCHNGSCTNRVCTDGCADGYYYYYSGSRGYCRRCLYECVTCRDKYECTSCIAGRDGSYCQYCEDGYYFNNARQCIQCNSNCLLGKCYVIGGLCKDGCQDGWSGWICNDACATNCDSCERLKTSTCKSCKPSYYGPSCNMECSKYCGNMSGERQCQKDGGSCHNCVMGYKGDQCDVPCDAVCDSGCDRDTGVCDGQTSGNQGNGAVIGGAVGSALVIGLIIVAVLVLIFIKKRRRCEADPERSVTYENSPIYIAPSTSLTPSQGALPNMEGHYTALTPSKRPVYEDLNKNDDVAYKDIKDYEVPNTSNYYNI